MQCVMQHTTPVQCRADLLLNEAIKMAEILLVQFDEIFKQGNWGKSGRGWNGDREWKGHDIHIGVC